MVTGELADTDEEWGNNTTAMTDMSSASWRAEQRAAMEEMPEEDDEDGRRRSSRRVTKGQRFQFWKNERPVYNKVSSHRHRPTSWLTSV